MKTRILLFLTAIFALFSYVSHAHVTEMDTTYVYTYDNSGNRTERVIDLTKSAIVQNGSGLENEQNIIEELEDFEIKIYPNPTKDILRIDIPGLDGQKPRLVIFNNQGRLLIDKKIVGSTNKISLSKYPAGMYILKIFTDQNSSEWKIIKD